MGKLDFKVKRLAVMKNEYFMVRTLRGRFSEGVHGTGRILIYEALGAKWALMPSTLHQLLIHERINNIGGSVLSKSFNYKSNLHQIFNI